MTDFAFKIEGDASEALRTGDTVIDRLARIREEAVKASKGMSFDNLANGFGKLGDAIRKEQQALQRTTQLHEQLARQNQPLTQGFASLAQAIQREQQMLEKIHGPAKQYAEDLQTLDALLRKNAISQAEYTQQKAQLDPSKGGGGGSNPLGKFGATVGFVASAPAVAMGALAGAKAGVEAIADYIEEQHKWSDEYITLQNSARRFTDQSTSLNRVMAEQGSLAKSLHSTLAPTMDLYDAIGDVTGDLNLTHKELIGLTKNLGLSALEEGKSMEAAGSVMGRLSIAMQSGADGAGQLRKIFREFPALGEALAKTWDTDTAGVIQMVSSHKRGIRDIVDVWSKSIPEIEAAEGKIQRTHEQAIKEYDERKRIQYAKGAGYASIFLAREGKDIDDVTGKNKSLANAFGVIVERLHDMAKEGERALDVQRADAWVNTLGRLPDVLNDGMAALHQIGDALGDMAQESPVVRALGLAQERAKQVHEATIALQALTMAHVSDFAVLDQGSKTVVDFTSKQKALQDIINGTTEAVKKQTAAVADDYQKTLQSVLGPQEEAAKQLSILGNLYMNGAISLEQYNNAAARHRDLLVELNLLRIKSQTGGAVGADAAAGAATAAGLTVPGVPSGGMFGDVLGTINFDNVRALQKKMADDAEAQAQRFREAWANAAGSAVASLAQMSREGKSSVGQMVEQIVRQLAMVAIQQAALRMGGSSGAFLGGLASAFSGLPGHAYGGVIYQGNGGTDSQIVAFRKSPNERMTTIVETPAQQRSGEMWGGGGGPAEVHVHLQNDRRDLVDSMDSRDGQRVVARLDRRMGRRRR